MGYERAKTMSGLDVIAALEQLERTGREIALLFEDYDLVLPQPYRSACPSSAGSTPRDRRR